MNAPRPNPPQELAEAGAAECRRYRFEPMVRETITLPAKLNGIIALRNWKLDQGLTLTSMTGRRRYSTGFMWADEVPEPLNSNGIYAYHLLSHQHATFPMGGYFIIGMVELAGRVIEHEDGSYRAECCRVLHFLAPTTTATRLSRVYGVPCTIADCKEEAGRKMLDWLGGPDGLRCLHHNAQLQADLEAERLLREVAALDDGPHTKVSGAIIPEEMKDRGGWLSVFLESVALDCIKDCLVFNNRSITLKYPGGQESFTLDHPCTYNKYITVVHGQELPGIVASWSTNPAPGFIYGQDFAAFNNRGHLIRMDKQQLRALKQWLRIDHRKTFTPAR